MNHPIVKNSEPVAKTFAWAAAFVLVVINGITLLQLFGVPITSEQGDAVVKVVESLLALVAILWATYYVRSQVTPVEKVEKLVIPAAVTATAGTEDLTGTRAENAGVKAGIEALEGPP